jgi:hypothetical protein
MTTDDNLAARVRGVPPERLGPLLKVARRHAGQRRAVASVRLGIARARLREIERGWVAASSHEIDRILDEYAATLSVVLPPRAPMSIDQREVHVGVHSRAIAGGHPHAALESYVELVTSLRARRDGGPLGVRRSDLEVLAAALGDDPSGIEARIVALVGCTEQEAHELRRELVRARLIAPVAGAAFGAMVIGGVVVASGSAPRPFLEQDAGAPGDSQAARFAAPENPAGLPGAG